MQQFWQMQIHPDDMEWKQEKKVLEKGLIGLGDWEESNKENTQQDQFEHEMKEGDVVLIRRGKQIIALVEIVGPYTYSKTTYDLLWFQRRRQIKVLDWYNDAYNYKCHTMGTLMRCADMSKPTNRDVLKWYKMVQQRRNQMTQTLNTLLRRSYNLILTGAPGTGKTYLAKQIAQRIIFGDAWTLKDENKFSEEERKEFKHQSGFVQFHPSYDYTDFVEGLRPTKPKNGNIGFELKDGVFKDLCKKALISCKYNETGEFDETNSPKFVFIIDEINRGEISKIFGELFFSVDPGYRGKKGMVETQYTNMIEDDDVFKAGFFVPENVYIIGTMNDIDRSVESLDFAMRRRFVFKEITAAESAANMNLPGNAKNRMTALNEAISKIDGLNPSYHIGAAYFLKEGKPTDDFAELWNLRLEPLLKEYLRGTPDPSGNIEKLGKTFESSPAEKNDPNN